METTNELLENGKEILAYVFYMLLVAVYCIGIIGAWISMAVWWLVPILAPTLLVSYVVWRLTKGMRRSSGERRANRFRKRSCRAFR